MGTRALALLLLLAAPSLALAQTATLIVSDTEISRAQCLTADTLTVTFTPTVTGQFTPNSDEYRLFAQTGSCSASLPSGTALATRIATDTSAGQRMNTTVDAVRQAIAAAVPATCDSADDVSYYLCVYLVSTGGAVIGTASGGDQMFQLAVPPQPSIGVAPANQALEVTVTPGTADATYKATASISYEAIATPVGGGTAVSSGRGGIGDTTLRINGLVNNQTYDVIARAFSSALNRGPDSAAVQGTPLPFENFWNSYQNAGGQEQGGCGGGAGALSLLALLPLALRRRRP